MEEKQFISASEIALVVYAIIEIKSHWQVEVSVFLPTRHPVQRVLQLNSMLWSLRIVRNNKTYTKNADVADQFNKHFINAGSLLASKIDNGNENPTQHITSSPTNSFVMSIVT